MVLAYIQNKDYVVAIPDRDIHYEELSLLNSDLKGIRVKPSPAVLPVGIPAGQVYPLPAFSAAEMAALQTEALNVLTAERALRGLGAQPAGAPGTAGAVFVAGTLVWVAAEKLGNIKFGDHVPNVAAVMTLGAKSIYVLPDGQSLFVECIDGGQIKRYLQKPAECDYRVVG